MTANLQDRLQAASTEDKRSRTRNIIFGYEGVASQSMNGTATDALTGLGGSKLYLLSTGTAEGHAASRNVVDRSGRPDVARAVQVDLQHSHEPIEAGLARSQGRKFGFNKDPKQSVGRTVRDTSTTALRKRAKEQQICMGAISWRSR